MEPKNAARDAIFVVPGIMGSTLVQRDLVSRATRTVWSLDYEHLVETLTVWPRILTADDLEAGKVIRYATSKLLWGMVDYSVDVYETLLSFLRLQHKGIRVIPFLYDWRKSNKRSAQLLADAIVRTPARRIYIVAHSMGGLVALLAVGLLRHSALLQRIDKVITIGTPHLGSAKSFRTLNERRPYIHDLLDNWFDLLRRHHPYASSQLADALHSFESIYELLPPNRFKILNRAGQAMHSLDPSLWTQPASQFALNAAGLHNQLESVAFERLYTIYATAHDTEEGYDLDARYQIIRAASVATPSEADRDRAVCQRSNERRSETDREPNASLGRLRRLAS